jgi:hypothetical protein
MGGTPTAHNVEKLPFQLLLRIGSAGKCSGASGIRWCKATKGKSARWCLGSLRCTGGQLCFPQTLEYKARVCQGVLFQRALHILQHKQVLKLKPLLKPMCSCNDGHTLPHRAMKKVLPIKSPCMHTSQEVSLPPGSQSHQDRAARRTAQAPACLTSSG